LFVKNKFPPLFPPKWCILKSDWIYTSKDNEALNNSWVGSPPPFIAFYLNLYIYLQNFTFSC